MTIKTRKDHTPTTLGEGPFQIGLTYEQLQLLGAFLSITKLGSGTYQNAAYGLMEIIETMVDDNDFSIDALGIVLPKFSIHDENTYDVIQTVDGMYISIDV